MADDFRFYAGLNLLDVTMERERERWQDLSRYYRGPRRVEDVVTSVTRALDGVSLVDIDGASLDGLREWIETIRARVPEAYREQAWLDFDRGDDETPASLNVFWKEPRAQAEIDADIEFARKWQEQERSAEEQKQRQQYEALKAKFEGKETNDQSRKHGL